MAKQKQATLLADRGGSERVREFLREKFARSKTVQRSAIQEYLEGLGYDKVHASWVMANARLVQRGLVKETGERGVYARGADLDKPLRERKAKTAGKARGKPARKSTRARKPARAKREPKDESEDKPKDKPEDEPEDE